MAWRHLWSVQIQHLRTSSCKSPKGSELILEAKTHTASLSPGRAEVYHWPQHPFSLSTLGPNSSGDINSGQ